MSTLTQHDPTDTLAEAVRMLKNSIHQAQLCLDELTFLNEEEPTND